MARRRIISLLVALAAVGVPRIAYVVAADDDGTAVCTTGDDRAECSNAEVMAAAEVGDESKASCLDTHENCRDWASEGECDDNPDYMLSYCRRSCKVCDFGLEENDFGKPQVNPAYLPQVKEIITKSVAYMEKISKDPEYASVINECRNNEENCSQWALGTGCQDNPKYMLLECSPACNSCDHVLDMKKKCGLDPEGKDAVEAGGMDDLFENMVRVAHEQNWEPTVLSRPMKEEEEESKLPCAEDITNPCDAQVGPWVITLENFLSADEINSLKDWGAKAGYERSQAGDEIIESRTSSHAWCNDDCYDDDQVVDLRKRIVKVTGIPEENYEALQLLKYLPGTYYRPHNDYIIKHCEQSHGPRLLTFFIYFNEVEEGGQTRFPYFSTHNNLQGLSVDPKPGRVLVWPSVLDEDPYMEDRRTDHEAVPVVRGEKFAANAWIHQRDFMMGFRAGCPS